MNKISNACKLGSGWCLTPIWFLPIFIFFSFYFAIGSYPLFDNNEGLYASIGKYMLLNKSFIIPYLNCVPYIEKPPLLYWLLSLSFSGFGFTAFAARFVTATSAALICLAMLVFTKKIARKTGVAASFSLRFFESDHNTATQAKACGYHKNLEYNITEIGITAALIFASSIGVSIIARMVYFDMLFTLLISTSLFGLFYWYESQKKPILRISYILVALAVLTKGLIAIILVGGSFGLFLILEKKFRSHFIKLLDPLAIILFLAVVLPWHIAAALEHKGFTWHYIVEEHFLRFLSKREPLDYYQGPIYYYLPRIMIYMFPWSLFVPLLFWRTKNLDPSEQRLLKFSWCWFLLPLLFFSLSKAKANYYMIVSVPAIALILSIKIKTLITKHNSKIFNLWVAVILFATALEIGFVFLNFGDALKFNEANKYFIIATIAYCFLAGIAAIGFVKKPSVAAVMLGGLIIPLVLTMVSYIKNIENDLSSAKVGVYLNTHAKDKSLYLYQDFENYSALAFYAPACFKIIDTQSSDLYYGAHLPEFKNRFINNKEFLQETSNKPLYIVVPNEKLTQFYEVMDAQEFSVVKAFDNLTVIEGADPKPFDKHKKIY